MPAGTSAVGASVRAMQSLLFAPLQDRQRAANRCTRIISRAAWPNRQAECLVFARANRKILCRDCEWACRGNFAHNFVPPKIIDERVARLDLMQGAVGRRRLQQRAQLHEMMAGAA